MFEVAVIALAYEPIEYLFVCVLLSLLIRQIKRITRLFIESGQSVCRVYETIFQAVQVHLARGASDHLIRA